MWGETGPYNVETTVYHERRIMVRIPTHRQPIHPGEMLREEFLEPMQISQRQLANEDNEPETIEDFHHLQGIV